MASNKVIRLGPVALGTGVTNIWNPPGISGGVNPPATSTNMFYLIRHIRAVNKVSTSVTVSAYIGTNSGADAGTEFAWSLTQVPANSAIDWFGIVRLDNADYLTANASSATAITVEAEGEIGVK